MADANLARQLRLYVITDPGARGGLVAATRQAVNSGATAVQLRWKGGTARQMLEAGRQLIALREERPFLLIVNDRLDVALALGADGVHLGDDDIPLSAARSVSPAGFIIGRSVDTVEEARAAERAGADYLGAGPVYATDSKTDTGPVMGVDGLASIANAVQVPVVGIGGISSSTASAVGRVAAGIAVLGAVMFSEDPSASTRDLAARLNG